MTRLVTFTGTALEIASPAVGRPGASSVSKALTCCNLEISASKCSTIVAVFMNPPSFILNDNERWPVGFMMTSSVAPFFAAWVRRTLSCGLAPISCAIAHPAPEVWRIGSSINANSPQGHMLRCEAERCAFPWLLHWSDSPETAPKTGTDGREEQQACLFCACLNSFVIMADVPTSAPRTLIPEGLQTRVPEKLAHLIGPPQASAGATKNLRMHWKAPRALAFL
jgi:hypothetical protein